MTKEDLAKYYLDLKSVNGLEDKEERDMIHSYYRDMITWAEDGRMSTAISFFNTLDRAGYIKNREQEDRSDKIGELING
jgi:hypothetical protein